MNKNAPVTQVILQSRSAAKTCIPHGSKHVECSLYTPKAVKMYGERLAVRGVPAFGRKRRLKVVPPFTRWNHIIALRRQGYVVLIAGYESTVVIQDERDND